MGAGGETTQIDLVLAAGTDRLLVALKTFITNYRRPGKNVTQSRDAILADLRVVGVRQDDHRTGAVLWLAYPIPTERDADWRGTHVRPIEKQAETKLLAKVNVDQACARVLESANTVHSVAELIEACEARRPKNYPLTQVQVDVGRV